MSKDKYIEKWLNGTLSDSEKAEFEQSKEHKFLNRLDNALKQFKAPDYQVDEELDRQISLLPKSKQVQITNWPSLLTKLAAVLILVSGLSFLYFNNNNDPQQLVSYSDTQEQIVLPDNSTVRLNAASNLSYYKNSWENERNVSLTGEAFFSVEKGEKFNVLTQSGKITVLGTQFNVKSRGDFFEVSCFEGAVAVSHNKKQVILNAGEQMQAFGGNVFQKEIKDEAKPSWVTGISKFDSVPVKEVFAEMERQFEISISYEKETLNPDRLFTGAFSNRNLDSALKSVTIPLNLSFKKSGSTITLTKIDN